MIDTPRSSNRSLATGLQCWLLGSHSTPTSPQTVPNDSLSTFHRSHRINCNTCQSFRCLHFCPTSPNAAHHSALRIHATCTFWRSEIALEGWVFTSVRRPRFGASFANDWSLVFIDPFVQANLLHTLQPPPRPCPPLLTQIFGFLILDNLRCEGRDPRELSNRSHRASRNFAAHDSAQLSIRGGRVLCKSPAQLYLLPTVQLSLLVSTAVRLDHTPALSARAITPLTVDTGS